MGSVSPLLAIALDLRKQKPDIDFLFLGTKNGPEKDFVEKFNIKFKSIASGKLRRYFDVQNLLTPFLIIVGFFQSLKVIRQYQPDIVLSAGSFVSVPIVWAAKFLKKKIMVHQMDLKVGLANKLMAPFADKITIMFQDTIKFFPKEKTVVLGNPYLKDILEGSREEAISELKLEPNLPTILVLGGGLGALKINQLVLESLPKLLKNFQVILVLGKGKYVEGVEKIVDQNLISRLHTFEVIFGKTKGNIFAAADLIITRAGISTLTELSVLEKPIIIVPIPNSQQEDNANFFQSNNAAIVLNQKEITSENLTEKINQLFQEKGELERLKNNIGKIVPKDANERFIKVMDELLGNFA